MEIHDVTSGELVTSDTLWCLHCGRSFPTKDLKIDEYNMQCCPYEGCDGGGVGIDLYEEKWWEEDNPAESGRKTEEPRKEDPADEARWLVQDALSALRTAILLLGIYISDRSPNYLIITRPFIVRALKYMELEHEKKGEVKNKAASLG